MNLNLPECDINNSNNSNNDNDSNDNNRPFVGGATIRRSLMRDQIAH